MADKITLKIDGQAVTVDKGTNILEAARSVGTSVPYFCYHPGLSSPAVCRQCLVDVKGQPKLVPSCYTPVADNMEVTTNSEKVLVARQQMLEFTLVNHPVDCPICDKAGECTLQKLYSEWDGAHTRTDVGKQHKPKVKDLGPEIVLDAERCILCTRCIRVCDEVAGQHQLEMAHRGDREQLTTAPGKQLDNPYSLNTVDVCPVGALTSKDFRFSMRVWELNGTPSICAGCATGCNDEVQHARGEIHRIVPRPNPDVNKYWMCDEGRMTYKEVRERRIAGARINGETSSVEKAIAAAETALTAAKSSGALGSYGVVLNAQATNEDNYLLVKIARALGIGRFYMAGRPERPEREDKILRHRDMNPNTTGMRAIAEWGSTGKARSTRQLADDLNSGQLKGLWILGDHVDLDEKSQAALAKLEFTLYQSPHENFLCDKMKIILPAASWAEIDGTFTNAKGMTQRARPAVEPPGEARPHHQLVALLAEKLGINADYPSARAIFFELSKTVPAFAQAQFGADMATVQLRFANSRG